jgi:uncharacterized protein YybS (DUF2232 family)
MSNSPQRQSTRGLTEGAILAALTAIVAAFGLFVPAVAIVLAPLPIILVVIRWGLRTGVLASVVAALILLEFFGPLNAVSVAALFAPLGLGIGWGVRRGLSAQLAVLGGASAFLASLVVAVAGITVVLHQDIIGLFITGQVKMLQGVLAIQQRMGAPAQDLAETRRWIEAWPHILPTAMPVFLALSALAWAYLCYIVARNLLRRVGHDLPGVPPMLAWRIPATLAFALVWAAAVISLISLRVPWMAGVSFDAVMTNVFVFGFQGALVAITWANRRQIPRIAQFFAGFLLLRTGNVGILGLTLVGMLDTWYDYRKLTGRPGSPTPRAGSDSTDISRAKAAVVRGDGDGGVERSTKEAVKAVPIR